MTVTTRVRSFLQMAAVSLIVASMLLLALAAFLVRMPFLLLSSVAANAWTALILIAVIVAMIWIGVARAEDANDSTGHAQHHDGFYKDLYRAVKDKEGNVLHRMHCCGAANQGSGRPPGDCAPAQYRMGKDGYEVLIGKKYCKVPEHVVLENQKNDTGTAHACFRHRLLDDQGCPSAWLCFVSAAEG